MEDTKLYTLKEAAKILSLGTMQSRIYLGDPQQIGTTPRGQHMLLYSHKHVYEVKCHREAIKLEKASRRGKKRCYHCHKYVPAHDTTSGICSTCQAYKIVKNFACHGDYINGEIDKGRLDCIVNAVKKLTLPTQEFQIAQ